MFWFHRAADFSSVSGCGYNEHLLISTIFTNHILGYLVVRMGTKHNGHALCIEWALSIGVATLANKKALFVTPVDRVHRFDAH